MVGWSAGWFVGRSAGWLLRSLVGRSVSSSVGWLSINHVLELYSGDLHKPICFIPEQLLGGSATTYGVDIDGAL